MYNIFGELSQVGREQTAYSGKLKKSGWILAAGLLMAGLAQTALAQQGSPTGATSAAPDGMPPEIFMQFGGSGTSLAPPEIPPNFKSLTGANYIYDTLRVITKSASRGCNSSDWNCMANLCKQDLGQTSWRGWAGCHAHDNDYICYFECSQTKQTF